VHGALAEPRYKAYCQHVKITLQEPVKTVLGDPVFTGLMLYHLLAYIPETCLAHQHRDIPVHLTVNLDALHHLAVISLQPAVEVVQLYSGELPCRVVV